MVTDNTYRPPDADVSEGRYSSPEGKVHEAAVEQLRGTRPWVLFLSILAFIGTFLMGISTIFILIAMVIGGSAAISGMMGGGADATGGGIIIVIMVMYFVVLAGGTLAYLFVGLHLFRFARCIEKLTRSGQPEDLTEALGHQRKFWKLMGILIIAGVVVYGLFFILVMAAGLLAG